MRNMNPDLLGLLVVLVIVGGIGSGTLLLATGHSIGWVPLLAGFLALFWMLGA